MIMKRAVELLTKLSDFKELQQNPVMQDSLIRRLLQIFSSDEGDNADLCLKMSCIGYMKNFFNDNNFKVEEYAHIVPPVVKQSSQMMRRLLSMGKPSIVNEVL